MTREKVLAASAAFLTRLREEDLAGRIEQVLASAAPGPRIGWAVCHEDSRDRYTMCLGGECEWCHRETFEYQVDDGPWNRTTAWQMDRLDSHSLWRPFHAVTDAENAALNPIRFPDLYGAWVYHPALLPPPGQRLSSGRRREQPIPTWERREIVRQFPVPADDPEENARRIEAFLQGGEITDT